MLTQCFSKFESLNSFFCRSLLLKVSCLTIKRRTYFSLEWYFQSSFFQIVARNFVTVFDAWNLNVLAYRFPGLHCNATDYRRDIAGIINGQQLKKRYAIDYRIINGQQAPPQMLWTCIKSRFSGSHCNYQQCQHVPPYLQLQQR